MNAERLHVIARAVKENLINTNLEGSLSNLVVNLQSQMNQPNASQHQQNVSATLRGPDALLYRRFCIAYNAGPYASQVKGSFNGKKRQS